MGQKEFDAALKDLIGESVDLLKCSLCGAELIECPRCHEMICPKGCTKI